MMMTCFVIMITMIMRMVKAYKRDSMESRSLCVIGNCCNAVGATLVHMLRRIQIQSEGIVVVGDN